MSRKCDSRSCTKEVSGGEILVRLWIRWADGSSTEYCLKNDICSSHTSELRAAVDLCWNRLLDSVGLRSFYSREAS
jgi:hypothetical protein